MRREFKEQARKIVSKSGIDYPFPENLDFSGIPPVQFQEPYQIDYLCSYGQDSPFFMGLKRRKLLGSRCKACDYRYATPRAYCMYCGAKTEWFELPRQGPRVYSLLFRFRKIFERDPVYSGVNTV